VVKRKFNPITKRKVKGKWAKCAIHGVVLNSSCLNIGEKGMLTTPPWVIGEYTRSMIKVSANELKAS
jgi:hypothetical protein